MPSKRHIELQNLVARWIENRSFKMCGLPESHVVGYVADFVAIAGMQNAYHERYTHHSGLEMMSMSSVLKDDYQQRAGNDRWTYKMHGDIDRWYVCVFEVKVSRADFLNTFGGKDSPHAKARMEPVGTAHWVVAEKGICKPDELPDFWGLLEPYGAGLTEKKIPKLNILPDEKLHAMAFDMLWLQMNYRVSYYDQLRGMAKTIKEVQQAVRRNAPIGTVRELLRKAVEACRGL